MSQNFADVFRFSISGRRKAMHILQTVTITWLCVVSLIFSVASAQLPLVTSELKRPDGSSDGISISEDGKAVYLRIYRRGTAPQSSNASYDEHLRIEGVTVVAISHRSKRSEYSIAANERYNVSLLFEDGGSKIRCVTIVPKDPSREYIWKLGENGFLDDYSWRSLELQMF